MEYLQEEINKNYAFTPHLQAFLKLILIYQDASKSNRDADKVEKGATVENLCDLLSGSKYCSFPWNLESVL